MKYIRAKANFYRYADEKLVVAAAHILDRMENSSLFVDPIPSLAEVKEAYTDYFEKVIEAKNKSRLSAAYKRESKRRLSDLLQNLAFYVNMVCDGDLAQLLSSGFPVLTGKRKGQSPDTPADPYLCDGRRSGEVGFGFKPVGRDMFYEYCFAMGVNDSGEPIWGEIHVNTKSFRSYMPGFTPGQYIYFRVRARNKHGHSRWTNPIRFLVR